jgi:sulfite exporter TauE/SafE
MNLLEVYFAFTLGLVGSLHCVQMCGPIVLSYSLPLASHSRGRQMAAHLAYNLGRTTTYAALGAVAGSAGAAVGLMGRLAGIEHVAAMVAGSLMIVAGIFMSGLIPRGQLARLYSFRPASWIAKAIGRPMQSPTAASKFTMGLALGFLPCGLIYAALLKAMETAAPLAGAVTMFAFGLGTVGALLLMGAFSTTIGLWLRHRSNQLAALGVTLMGGFLLYRGIMASMHQAQMHH